MPSLSGVSDTSLLVGQLAGLLVPSTVTTNTATKVVAENAATVLEFVGTGLEATLLDGYLAGFLAGTWESLTVRNSVTNAVLVRIADLGLDLAPSGSPSDDPGAFLAFFASLDWTMSGTGGDDFYDLSDVSGFYTTSHNVINLFSGDDYARGGYGVDIIDSGTGNDTIDDSKGNDVARGGLGDDLLAEGLGANGNDKLYGDIGNDSIWGGLGKDKLYGGAGDDSMNGGTGDDLMNGGKGRDIQDGGAGADVFVFGTSDGADVITGFELAFDTLRINATSIRITETDGDAVVRFGTTAVTLDGIARADLVMGDHIVLI